MQNKFIEISLHQFMQRIWESYGEIFIPLINGSVTVFRDEPNPHDSIQKTLCYWFQFSQNLVLAVIPYDVMVKVDKTGSLIIPKKYISTSIQEPINEDLELWFFKKADVIETDKLFPELF